MRFLRLDAVTRLFFLNNHDRVLLKIYVQVSSNRRETLKNLYKLKKIKNEIVTGWISAEVTSLLDSARKLVIKIYLSDLFR